MIEKIYANYPDIVSVFMIPLVISIFALSFPLLFQTASRIDDKYNSTLLIEVFKRDRICKWFLCTLVVALIACCLWGLQLPRLVDCGELVNNIIDNSALIFLVVSTILLVVSTISSIWLMYVYYMPELLFNRLRKQYNSKRKKDKPILFIAISKLMHYAIKNSDYKLSLSILEFYVGEFFSFRVGKKNEKCTYPKEYYRVIYETNELVYMEPKKETSFFNESVMLGLLIDEYQGTILSDETYMEIWKGLRQALYYNREDFVTAYWRKAHQYMNFYLCAINPIYDDNFNIINRTDVDTRNMEREKFLEFHYTLGGLLMMKKKYSLINQLTTWTNQSPPRYVLVPETMEDVIKRFMEVDKQDEYVNMFYYEKKYPFPDISGVNANNIIKMWIKRYIAILFLRQYVLHEYFIYSRTLEMPNPPQTLLEKKKWIEELNILKGFVTEYLSDQTTLKQLNLEVLGSPNWFEDNNKPKPIDLIEKLLNKIETSIENTKRTQTLDSNKIKQFEDETTKILSHCFDYYEQIFKSEIDDTVPYNSFFYRGRYEISDKMAFAEDQDCGYSNIYSIFAEVLATEFRYNMPNIFRVHCETSIYTLLEKDVFSSIDNLQLGSQQFTILSVGINLNTYNSKGVKSKDEGRWEYNGIPIVELGYTLNDAVNNSFFIMKNEDLPCILHREVNKAEKEKYNLSLVDSKYYIYTSIIDLHQDSNIRDEVREKTGIQDLDKSVLVCVDLKTEVRLRKNAKCIQLKVFSHFDDIGNPNNPNDVKNIWASNEPHINETNVVSDSAQINLFEFFKSLISRILLSIRKQFSRFT